MLCIIGVAVLPHMRILAHTRMGRPICVYSYGTPIRVWDNILSHMSILFACFISYRSLHTAAINKYNCAALQRNLLGIHLVLSIAS